MTAGIVSWVLRAGSLMTSFLSVVPLWKQIDPLPVLSAAAVKKAKDDAGAGDEGKHVEEIFDKE